MFHRITSLPQIIYISGAEAPNLREHPTLAEKNVLSPLTRQMLSGYAFLKSDIFFIIFKKLVK